MLRSRLIPCLLIRDKGLVKTRRFTDDKYVGDPINTVKIFNDKEADEIIVLDIDASSRSSGIDFKMVQRLAAECRMPLAYGGGIQSLEQARHLISLGIEKVILGSAAVRQPQLLNQIASELGSQSLVAVIDAKKKPNGSRWDVRILNGRVSTGLCPIEFAQRCEQYGVGEIVLNSIDHDGLMEGYDLELADQLRASVNVPITILGGAGSLSDIRSLIMRIGTAGAGAGSLFLFKGPYRALLVNYPSYEEKCSLLSF